MNQIEIVPNSDDSLDDPFVDSGSAYSPNNSTYLVSDSTDDTENCRLITKLDLISDSEKYNQWTTSDTNLQPF